MGGGHYLSVEGSKEAERGKVGEEGEDELEWRDERDIQFEARYDQGQHLRHKLFIMEQSEKVKLQSEIEDQLKLAIQRKRLYLASLLAKRNRVSLFLASFMHNVVNIEGSVDSESQILY